MAEAQDQRLKLMVVIVLYKMQPENSIAFRTLQSSISNKADIRVLLFDNTPGGSYMGTLPANVQYEAAANNAGLAEAYNRALAIATAEGYDWLLTLDQDTSLPEDFIPSVEQIVLRVASDDSVAAIVPIIVDGGIVVSPTWWLWSAIPRAFPATFSGVSRRTSSAFNSASVVRVSTLTLIGGYNQRFWLDNLDSDLYARLYKRGKRLYVASNIHVEHQFSMRNMNERVTLARYQNILSAGCAFWDMELGWLAALDYNARLIYRTFFKHWKQGHDPAFRRASMEMLKRRLLHSRKRRIADWKKETERWIA